MWTAEMGGGEGGGGVGGHLVLGCHAQRLGLGGVAELGHQAALAVARAVVGAHACTGGKRGERGERALNGHPPGGDGWGMGGNVLRLHAEPV